MFPLGSMEKVSSSIPHESTLRTSEFQIEELKLPTYEHRSRWGKTLLPPRVLQPRINRKLISKGSSGVIECPDLFDLFQHSMDENCSFGDNNDYTSRT